jgi:hypothetical protein
MFGSNGAIRGLKLWHKSHVISQYVPSAPKPKWVPRVIHGQPSLDLEPKKQPIKKKAVAAKSTPILDF